MRGRARNIRRRLKKHRLWVVSAIVLLFALVSIYIIRALVELSVVRPAPTYHSFGVKLPSGFRLYGIDVSKYQGDIDWQSVRKMRVDSIQLSFAFMKATEGLSLKDDMFTRNWKNSKEAGLSRGAYHFFMPDRSGQAQASFFIRNVQLERGDLSPVLDIESMKRANKKMLIKEAKTWLQSVENYYHVKPIIYTNVSFYKSYLERAFDDYPLWIAQYKTDPPAIDRYWVLWQHSEKARINGILTRTDFNVFNGDSLAFSQLLVDSIYKSSASASAFRRK